MCVWSCVCVYGCMSVMWFPGGGGAWKMWTAPWFGWSRHGGRWFMMVPCFCCWVKSRRYQPHCLSLPPSILPSVSPRLPPRSEQLHQHDKSLKHRCHTSSSLSALFSISLLILSLYFSAGTLTHVYTHTRTLHFFSQSYLQTLPASMSSIPRCRCHGMSRQRYVIFGLTQSLASDKLYPSLILPVFMF